MTMNLIQLFEDFDTDAECRAYLEELRWRLLKSVVAVIVMSGAAFYFADPLLRFLVEPLGEVKLHYTEVTGSFYAYLKISLIAGMMGALPIIFYQLWSFISPGLHAHEKMAILPMVAVSTFISSRVRK